MNTQTSQVTAAQFLSLFGNGGILMFGRHGNALKATPGQIDRDRELSPKGEQQVSSIAQAIRQTMAGREFDLVVASPAERARRTACVATGCSREELGTVEALRISEDKSEPCNVMFEALMYSPLSEYFKHANAEHLRELGRRFLAEIVALTAGTMAARQDSNRGAKVFVGGHAVFTPQVVWTLGQLLIDEGYEIGESLQKFSIDLNVGEAEVIKLTFIGSNESDLGGIAMELLKP